MSGKVQFDRLSERQRQVKAVKLINWKATREHPAKPDAVPAITA